MAVFYYCFLKVEQQISLIPFQSPFSDCGSLRIFESSLLYVVVSLNHFFAKVLFFFPTQLDSSLAIKSLEDSCDNKLDCSFKCQIISVPSDV